VKTPMDPSTANNDYISLDEPAYLLRTFSWLDLLAALFSRTVENVFPCWGNPSPARPAEVGKPGYVPPRAREENSIPVAPPIETTLRSFKPMRVKRGTRKHRYRGADKSATEEFLSNFSFSSFPRTLHDLSKPEDELKYAPAIHRDVFALPK
jgi:hypothetical protein